MAAGQRLLAALAAGQRIGEGFRQQRSRNAIARAFQQAYEDDQTVNEPLPGGGFSIPTAPPEMNVGSDAMPSRTRVVRPAGINMQNAIGNLYREGLGPEAFEMEGQMANRELAMLTKAAQLEQLGAKAPTTRQVPVGNGSIRTEEWNPQTRQWTTVAEGKRAPLVNIDTKSDQKFAEEKAKQDAQSYAEQEKTAGIAQSLLDVTQRARSLLPEIRTGAGAGVEATFGSWLQAAGADPTKMGLMDPAKAEEFQAAASQSVSLIRQVLKFPAAGFSDADRLMLEKAVAGLGKNSAANLQILDAAEKVAQREQERLSRMDAFIKKRGNLNGFNAEWIAYQRQNPLFKREAPTPRPNGTPGPLPKKYTLGQIIDIGGGKKVRVIGIDPSNPDDPDVAPL